MDVAEQRPGTDERHGSGGGEPRLVPPGTVTLPPRRFADLVLHLARREIAVRHEGTLIGWAWPVLRQLAQLAVLVFVFGSVLDLEIENFAVFVFTGLIAWSWFSSGVGAAASSLLDKRHLVFQPRLPSAVVPLVAVAVPLVDVVFALPIVLVMLVLAGELSWHILLWPGIMAVQFLLMAGLAWLTAGLSVLYRDVPGLVTVALTLLFYLTPIFYGVRSIPDDYQWILQLNPLTSIVTAYRSAMAGEPGPSIELFAAVAVLSAALAFLGWRVFRRLEPRFADSL